MPLPSKSIRAKDWLYAGFGIAGLASRKEYLLMYKPERVKALQSLIRKHTPKLVMFYSLTYLADWASVAEVPLEEVIPKKLYIAKDDNTMYVVVPHSTSYGMSRDDWKDIAMALQAHLPSILP
jgi:hypothetical protein